MEDRLTKYLISVIEGIVSKQKMYLNKDKTWNTILSATNKLVDFVAHTYGPAGNNVILTRFGRIQAVDDGHIISEEFSLENPFENDVINFIRESARATNKKVEDGNVTTLLLVKALLNGIKEGDSIKNFVDELEKCATSAKLQLLDSSFKITTKEQVASVARIAFNHKKLSELIADVILDVGDDGVIIAEYSTGKNIVAEKVSGTRFERGYCSSHFTNDEAGKKCEFDNPLVLITDKKISTHAEAKLILEIVRLYGNGRPMVIVSDGVTDNALNTIVQNKVRGFEVVAIDAPEFGERKQDFLIDLCNITGAKLISIEKPLEKVVITDFGGAGKVICTEQETTIIGGQGSEEQINNRVAIWKQRINNEDITNEQKIRAKKAIANLLGGVVTIKVGANTDIEVESHMPKVKNAISSARLAYKSGVVAGAGVALALLKTGNDILDSALRVPYDLLKNNCGESSFNQKAGDVKNYITGKVGGFMEVGVMDPVELLTTCIDSAVSIVSLLVKSKGIINNSK